MKRLLLFCVVLSLAVSSFAGLAPTQAWRRIFGDGSTDVFAGGLDVDASGNAYVQYMNAASGHNVMHVTKIAPPSGITFDKTVDFLTANVSLTGVVVSPIISGKQYVYAFVLVNSSTPSLNIYKWDTSGIPQWSGTPVILPTSSGTTIILAGVYPDASNNLLVAVGLVSTSAGGALYMDTIDSSANLTSQQSNPTIGATNAVYIPSAGGWVASGYDFGPFQTSPLNSARWDFYNASNGQASGIGDQANGGISGFSSTVQQFLINGLPGGQFSVVHNTTNGGLTGSTFATSMKVFNSSFATLWSYPSGAPWGAYTFQVTQLNSASPYYMVSQIPGGSLGSPNPRIIDQFSASGSLVWEHRHQPADLLLPWSDGFFTAFYNGTETEYLEHADSTGVYDFGKSYVSAGGSSSASTFGGMRGFQNSLYFLNNTRTASSTRQLVVDRFVTGICMQSVTSASSTVQGCQQLQVVINLNAPAPAGGVSVGLSTSNNKLLLPNGTQGQFITVPAGASFVAVNLNAQGVAGSTPVRVLGIQNGIRRFVDVTVTP